MVESAVHVNNEILKAAEKEKKEKEKQERKKSMEESKKMNMDELKKKLQVKKQEQKALPEVRMEDVIEMDEKHVAMEQMKAGRGELKGKQSMMVNKDELLDLRSSKPAFPIFSREDVPAAETRRGRPGNLILLNIHHDAVNSINYTPQLKHFSIFC